MPTNTRGGHFAVVGVVPSLNMIGVNWPDEMPDDLRQHAQETIAMLKDELLREAPVAVNA